VTLQDLGNLGELVGGAAVVVSLVYLAIQIRHNTRGLDQNTELMRLSFEEAIRREAVGYCATIASKADLADVWVGGLAGEARLDRVESARFELLMVAAVAILRAQFDAHQRGLYPENRGAFFRFVAGTPGFQEWWGRRGTLDDREFAAYVESLSSASGTASGEAGEGEPAA
jgi:hypothetical protein